MTEDHFAESDALSIVRLVEQDMAHQALSAWQAANARRGLSDHEALTVHADALTRWSERLRMALSGQDYRDRHDRGCAADVCSTARCQCLTPPARGFGLLRSALPDDDLTPITGGLYPDTEVVDTRPLPPGSGRTS